MLSEDSKMINGFLLSGQDGLQNLLESIKDKDPDKVSIGLASTLDTVAQLELLQVLMIAFRIGLIIK